MSYVLEELWREVCRCRQVRRDDDLRRPVGRFPLHFLALLYQVFHSQEMFEQEWRSVLLQLLQLFLIRVSFG